MQTSDFREIVRELKQIKEQERLSNVDDNLLFDAAVRIYNSISINKQRSPQQGQQKLTSNGQKQAKRVSEPMTEKQRKLLQNLHYRGNMNLSKSEATKVIEQELAEQRA